MKRSASRATASRPSVFLRLPKGASASAACPRWLVMCGADMYKEDREKYSDYANAEGMAALVVDAPGTGQTTFPHAPSRSSRGRPRSTRSPRGRKSTAIASALSA